MQVGMHQFLHFLAGGAHATAVGLGAVRTEDILGVGQGQRQFPASGRTQKELCVRDMVFPHTLDKPLFDGALAYDVFELHDILFLRAKIQFFVYLSQKRLRLKRFVVNFVP
jgi:hypothetical protein